MSVTKKLIERFLELSLNPVPVKRGSKIPLREAHQTAFIKLEIDKYDWGNLDIGISTGFASLNLEALDFDLKNVEDPEEFMRDYKALIPERLLNNLVIQRTPSGGYHFIYRCDEIESNQKLARNSKGEATIETRGIGGYIKCFPSKGYEIVSKISFDSINIISPSERRLLFALARQKDELLLRDNLARYSSEDKDYLSKFKDYNSDPQIGIDLLEKYGWVFHSQNRDWYNLTRPGSLSGDLHAGYNTKDCFFQVWSTAQDIFQTKRGYNNHHIFAELECKGNYAQAYAKLYEGGYGGSDKSSSDDSDESSLSFVSTWEKNYEVLEQTRKGEIPLGVTLGWSDLDPYLRFKKNTFYFFLGLDNIGKSTILSSIMASTNLLHGFKWGISSPEGLVSTSMNDLIECASGKSIEKFNKDELQKLISDLEKSFVFISNEEHYTIDKILEYGKMLYQQKGIDFLIIDPFSFYSGSGKFNDDTEVLSKIRVFVQNYCSVIVVDHPVTSFAREKKDKDGFTTIPTKYDASGGNSKANRCDDFICLHRIINHPDEDIKRTMQIAVEKVKTKRTGGQPHANGEYCQLIWETRDGFTGYWDTKGQNPMYTAKVTKEGLHHKVSVKPQNPEDVFL